MDSPSLAGQWQSALASLCGRFPSISPQRVAQILRDNQGHAGRAASELRELLKTPVQEADLDDKEHVEVLLSSSAMFKYACDEHFQKYDTNKNGLLEWDEIQAVTVSLYDSFGLKQPSDEALRAFFDSSDVDKDGALSATEFQIFFESFLQHSYFDIDRLRKIVDSAATHGVPKQ